MNQLCCNRSFAITIIDNALSCSAVIRGNHGRNNGRSGMLVW